VDWKLEQLDASWVGRQNFGKVQKSRKGRREERKLAGKGSKMGSVRFPEKALNSGGRKSNRPELANVVGVDSGACKGF
jgi:hypothetical protein